MRAKRHFILTFVAFLLVISIACDISFKESAPTEREIAFELTLQALQKTQTAAAQSSAAVDDTSSEDSENGDDANGSDSEPADENEDCNMSKFVSETIPDDSVYQPGDTFTKSWVIRNIGICDWTTGYRMVFEEGDQMGGPSSMHLSHVVEPGDTYTFEMDLTAPGSNGDYTGVWRIKSDDGENLGKYWVKITVGSASPPSPMFAVTSVTYYMPHTSIDMGCPGDVTISAEITTSAGGLVTFIWDDSNGCPGCATKSLSYAGAESKILQHTMTIASTGDYWAKIYIDEPNHQWFGQKNFHVNCTP